MMNKTYTTKHTKKKHKREDHLEKEWNKNFIAKRKGQYLINKITSS